MRKALKSSILFFGLAANMAHAESIADQVIAQLTEQGYQRIEIYNGTKEVRVEATKDGRVLEVVYDATTGEILSQEVSLAGQKDDRSDDDSNDDSNDDDSNDDDSNDDDSNDDDSNDDDSNDDDGNDDDGNDDDRGSDDDKSEDDDNEDDDHEDDDKEDDGDDDRNDD